MRFKIWAIFVKALCCNSIALAMLGFVKFPGGNKAEKMKVNSFNNEIEWVMY
jgi:hypothetical protein